MRVWSCAGLSCLVQAAWCFSDSLQPNAPRHSTCLVFASTSLLNAPIASRTFYHPRPLPFPPLPFHSDPLVLLTDKSSPTTPLSALVRPSRDKHSSAESIAQSPKKLTVNRSLRSHRRGGDQNPALYHLTMSRTHRLSALHR